MMYGNPKPEVHGSHIKFLELHFVREALLYYYDPSVHEKKPTSSWMMYGNPKPEVHGSHIKFLELHFLRDALL